MLCKHLDTKVKTLFILFYYILFYYIPYVFARIMEKDVHKVDRKLKFDLREPPAQSYLPPAVRADFTDDLFVAGLKEKTFSRCYMLGPIFYRIFAAQFLNLKRTDRFFYNYVDQPTLLILPSDDYFGV